MDRIMRSVTRDTQAMRLGLPAVEAEIKKLEGQKKKDRSVKKRLERLYAARNHLTNSPQESKKLVEKSLVQQLQEINGEDKRIQKKVR